MQRTSGTDETSRTYTCNIYVKHMQHPDITLATCNMKTLAAKGRLEQMKYLEHTITTYM
jgi:hypothetical protein